jgi:hypothetical protein
MINSKFFFFEFFPNESEKEIFYHNIPFAFLKKNKNSRFIFGIFLGPHLDFFLSNI